YVVTCPAVIYHPRTTTLWVHLSGLHKPVQVTIQLQRADKTQNITLLEREVQEPRLYLNITFPAPAPAKGSKELAELHVAIQGESLQVFKKKKVMLKALQPGIFIQTDRAVYKPGQQVKFRVVSLDHDLVARNEKDPSGNRIAQWQEVTPQQGIVDLSLPLAAEPALGTYTIEVKGQTQSFSVEEYVLPRFKMSINLPPVVLKEEETFQIEICGRYTYGKPVQGKVQASLCKVPRYNTFIVTAQENSCLEVSGQTERNGCFSREIPLTAFNITRSMHENPIKVTASLVEDGTGLEMKDTKNIKIVAQTFIVTFEHADGFYRPGIPYTGTMMLKGANDAAQPQEQLLLIVSHRGGEVTQTLLTDSSGRASFKVDTSGWTGTVSLKGQVKEPSDSKKKGLAPPYQSAHRRVSPFFSASKSFLQLRDAQSQPACEHPQQLWVDLIFSKEALETELDNLDVVFLVLAKGNIATVLRKEVPAEPGLRSFSLEVPMSHKLAPEAKVLAYAVLPSGEMVADSTELQLAKCLPSKVKVAFSEDRALPGSALQLQLEAAPGSLCALRAVDRSVLLLKPEAELSAELIYKALPEFNYPEEVREQHCSFSWDYDLDYDFPFFTVPSEEDSSARSRRQILPSPSWSGSKMDTYKLFQVKALPVSACIQELAVPCSRCWESTAPSPECHAHSKAPSLSHQCQAPTLRSLPTWHSMNHIVPKEPPAPRTYFPETWLWDLVPVGESGSAEVPVTAPDTITSWEAGMFCTSPLGLGLAPATTLTTFKPFFVELALPYSVVRREAFTLVATVFNYLQQCLRVQVRLEESSELEVSAAAGEEYSSCVCADEARTFRWDVRATSLGEVNITISTEAVSSSELCGNELPVVPAQGAVDTLIKPLLVQPGGILVEKAHNSLLCQEATEEFSLEVPADTLEGSERAHITVMGDIMGNAVQNLDRLLTMPSGCGEQNMVHFAPNIYIQQYLEKTGQLHPDIRAKAQSFLQSGYQRELLYKHNDGSYSAFGKSDGVGNTWLTAFVLKSFGQARAYVAIEERHIEDALRWLKQQQKQQGCFRSVGKLFNNALQGGVSDELSLSAYVTVAMLELGLSPTDPTVSSALRCLEDSATDDIYTQALLAYVLGLAGRWEQQQALLKSLAQHSVSAEGQLHWQRKGKAVPSSQSSWAAAAPAEVEITAYVLLAYLSQPQVSSADLSTASQIVRWLSRQQNPYGGFASTQDTVVALQALAKYAALTYGDNGDFVVTVTSPTGTTQDFELHNSTRLLLQRAALHQLPGTYRVHARGQGCALLQATLRYNVPPSPGVRAFDLHVETKPKTCKEDAHARFSLLLRARYTGERPTTNMVVIEAKLPSGYIPDKKSVVKLKSQKLVKKVEVQPDQVTIYLDQLTKEEETFSFDAELDFPVKDLQPATVTLYDYYETGE
ncbi:A2ML1 protein, partial [Ramphastos sulfuratus]|nr:A2ML1 protein [Ramphastos sulfuratus]